MESSYSFRYGVFTTSGAKIIVGGKVEIRSSFNSQLSFLLRATSLINVNLNSTQ
jgi:hypothetical protein